MAIKDEFGRYVYEGDKVVHVTSASNLMRFKLGVVQEVGDEFIQVDWVEASKPFSWSLPSKPTKIRKNFVIV